MNPDAARALVEGWPQARTLASMVDLIDRAPLFDLELSAACNVDCAFCPRTRLTRPARAMSESTFSAVLDFLPAHAIAMCAGLGDPLANSKTPPYVRRLADRGVSACVVTNGVLLDEKRQDALIAAGVAQIQVSLPGLSEQAYRRAVPQGGDLPRVVANLQRLAQIRPLGLRVRVNFVLTPDNHAELASIREFAKGLGFDLDVRRLHSRGGGVHSPRAADQGLPSALGCGLFAAVTFITAQGDILSCVNDTVGASRLGNVRGSTWAEIVAAKARTVSSGNWFPACGACDDDSRWTILAAHSVEVSTDKAPIPGDVP